MTLTATASVLLLSMPVLFILRRVSSLVQNYLDARSTGLPILINPIGLNDPIWFSTRNYTKPLLRLLLPRALSAWTYRDYIAWTQQPKYDIHAKLGADAFWVVTPDSNNLYVADADAAGDILRRFRTEFIKNPKMYSVLDIFGPNVNSANGKAWERHRRITVPPFNERVSEMVWEEAGRQVMSAREAWTAPNAQPVRKTQEGCTQIALHVLTAAGFGKPYEFDAEPSDGHVEKTAGHKMSYRRALGLLINSVFDLVLYNMIRKAGWPHWATWGRVREVGTALGEFRQYLEEFVREERERVCTVTKSEGKEDLMSVLVRSADRERQKDEKQETGNRLGLSDSEVYGNMFLYNLAGHDTTANTIHFALTLLAIHPEWQDWLAVQIQEVAGARENADMDYKQVFPKLTRCLALMYETLRLYGAVPVLPRWTGSSSLSLMIGGKEVALPPESDVLVNIIAIHTHPKYWGNDAGDFRPERWLLKGGDSDCVNTRHAGVEETPSYTWQSEDLLQPEPGTFIPWIDGPRVCPGKKFAQVEFVRVMAGLFGGADRVRIKPEPGETKQAAKGRVLRLLEKSKVRFALTMPQAESVGMEWYNI